MKIKLEDLSGGIHFTVFLIFAAIVCIFVFKNVNINFNKTDYGQSKEDMHYRYRIGDKTYYVKKGTMVVKYKKPVKVQLKDGFLYCEDGVVVTLKPQSGKTHLNNIHNSIGEYSRENIIELLDKILVSSWSHKASNSYSVNDINKSKYHSRFVGQNANNNYSVYQGFEDAISDCGLYLESVYWNGKVIAKSDLQ